MPGATIVNHRHCAVCGKAILTSEVTCEGECEGKFQKIQRRRRLVWPILFVLNAVFVMLYLSLL